MDNAVSITIRVPMDQLLEMVKVGKIDEEFCPDKNAYTYEAHFEMPSRIDGYEIDDYSPDVEEEVAQALIAKYTDKEAAA